MTRPVRRPHPEAGHDVVNEGGTLPAGFASGSLRLLVLLPGVSRLSAFPPVCPACRRRFFRGSVRLPVFGPGSAGFSAFLAA